MDETQKKILETVIVEYKAKGLKFTMDDIAKELHMSKKTIYKIYHDKEEMLDSMVDYVFNSIKESEHAILNDNSLTTAQKVSKILIALPDSYQNVDFRLMFQLKDKYPKVYSKINDRLESDWEETIALIEQGIEEGSIRPISIPTLKVIFEATVEKFLSSDVLIKFNMEYQNALNNMIDILMEGIRA
ncbi:transcriptional regulator, TetR family [Butyrivibrio fibrisolvens]|jgi:AcrR family transcriptional regulator|uniref:Transcriptional regulator, TetR family n=1 Tax=Butyrivibrio fibrisolvens TaxID=831 RepID=A0A1H9WYF7_BUTFI|nr:MULTISPECIES: TetR/AcrR family transcriptional regulator [Butyrivibrio]MCR4637042.1 TetR/AcrR family transcriptional regulator [Butyrivibrio sp.]SES38946.1 transcriptional regulator, TetR family [Butyrivibrio fibrisolvens]